MEGISILGQGVGGAFGTFMTSRPLFCCSHWLEFVYTEYCHDIIYVPAMQMFNDKTSCFTIVEGVEVKTSETRERIHSK